MPRCLSPVFVLWLVDVAIFIFVMCVFFFFQAEDGIRDLVRSRGLGDVYKRQRETGRWDFYGKELLRFKDRHERDFCLGPTHEEVLSLIHI